MAVHFENGLPCLIKGTAAGAVEIWNLNTNQCMTEGRTDLLVPGQAQPAAEAMLVNDLMVIHRHVVACSDTMPPDYKHLPAAADGGPPVRVGSVQMMALDGFPNGARMPFMKAAPQVTFTHSQEVSEILAQGM